MKNLKKFSAYIFFAGALAAAFSYTQLHKQIPQKTHNSIEIKILGVNDFHGQLTTGRKLHKLPVGGAAILAAYLQNGQGHLPDNAILALIGDQVGASIPASGLLNHEPSILFFNSLANTYCQSNDRMNPKCNIVATIGNHEFDRGQQALFNLINGNGKAPTEHWIDLPTYPGANFPFVSANIVYAKTGKKLFQPYVIKEINGIKIAFIGVILKNTADVVSPNKIKHLKFLDEAETINYYLPEVKRLGADLVVVILHQGGEQLAYPGNTDPDRQDVTGPINDIIKHLNNDVDIVMAGHSHQFINAYLPNADGRRILVTEANSYSESYADITVLLDPVTHKIQNEFAKIIDTDANKSWGKSPDKKVAALVKLATDKIAADVNVKIGILKNTQTRAANPAGEITLGNLIADAYRNIIKTDISFTNPGSIRADLSAGKVSWGNLYAMQPFGDEVGKLFLSGKDIKDLLEQQWQGTAVHILQFSGFSYRYNTNLPVGSRVVAMTYHGHALQLNKMYSIATNGFLASGGDGFTVMKRGIFVPADYSDLEALIKYIKSLPQPFTINFDKRIEKLNRD